MSARTKWRLVGDYLETCNCDIACPCLVSTKAMMAAPAYESHALENDPSH
jgi:hypothetical protein